MPAPLLMIILLMNASSVTGAHWVGRFTRSKEDKSSLQERQVPFKGPHELSYM